MKPSSTDGADFILLQADKKIHKVNLQDILFSEAMGDYVKAHTVDKTIIVHHTLQNLHERLRAHKFFRVHKSYLHRIEYIEGNMMIMDKTNSYRTDLTQ